MMAGRPLNKNLLKDYLIIILTAAFEAPLLQYVVFGAFNKLQHPDFWGLSIPTVSPKQWISMRMCNGRHEIGLSVPKSN